jgi:predicted TIM-barrel fold metal-dependent hydrolase
VSSDSLRPSPRIDAHTHVFAPVQVAERVAIAARDATFAELYADRKSKLATPGDLLAAMERAKLDGAVAAGFAFSNARDIETENEALFGLVAESTGRVAALATVNPTLPGWRAQAEAALGRGARGFGELRPGNQGWDPLGPPGMALCELAAAHGAVLLWHVSEPVGHRYPGKDGGISPGALIELATRFSGLRMVGAHLGAGAAFYLQMPELRLAIDSLYFDTAACSLLYHESTVARVVDLTGPGRVLFGSDYPLLSPARQLDAIGSALPDDAVRDAVLGGNAASLYFHPAWPNRSGVSRSGA